MSYNLFINLFPEFYFLEPFFEKDLIKAKTWAKGEFVCHCNQELNIIIFFTSGRGKVYNPLNNGKEVIHSTYGSGEIAGDVEYILSEKTTCSLESSEDLSGYILNTKDITKDISYKLLYLLSKEVARKLQRSSIKQSIWLGYTLEERLAYYILYQNDEGIFSMEELAAILGTTYRHLSRGFKKLTSQKIITLHNKKVSVLKPLVLKDLCKTLSLDINN